MIKVFMSVRNRLAITKKSIAALWNHTTSKFQLYVYDNSTNHRLEEHFQYFHKLYSKGLITQITFNTDASTFNAFSKAVACNQFGYQHETDPKKDKYKFLMIMDNDIVVTPGWDEVFSEVWKEVHQNKMKHIKVIGQLPGGIKHKHQPIKLAGYECKPGKLGGSGLWSIRNNFFSNVGYLPLDRLVNQAKLHDQIYWRILEKKTKGQPYILGIKHKLGIHCGKVAGSVCNVLTRGRNNPKEAMEKIKFKEAEKKIDNMSFQAFYDMICKDKSMSNDW